MKEINFIGDLIGNTPIYTIDEPEGKILVKLEGQNPGGSIKDRAALAMIEDAEKTGKLKPGGVIIEPTSGNTGIGLAMIGTAKGYRVIIVMPETMSEERRRLIASYGAELILTEGYTGMAGAVEKAKQLTKELNAFMPAQFDNPANAMVHERVTAREIIDATNGQFDAFVAGIGSGGTFTGISRALKREYPHIKRIAVEPKSSPLLSEGKAGAHRIQGIGANFIPSLLDQTLIDRVIAVSDNDAIETAKELGRKHGLLVGISTGAAVAASRQLLKEGFKKVLCISPDRGERYLSVL